jgi:hypothetical protein
MASERILDKIAVPRKPLRITTRAGIMQAALEDGRQAMLRGIAQAFGILALCLASSAFAQSGAPILNMGGDLVPAPDGYEAVTGKYVTAKPTDLYISPFVWAGKVMGVHLNAGAPVEVLARAKGYDWLIVGKNGMPLGYIPSAALSPAKQ